MSKKNGLLIFLFILLTAYFSVGHHHPDEHFQLLEFAALKLGLTQPQNLPWEYQEKMRPALQPSIVVIIYKTAQLFRLKNPFIVVFLLRLISGTLSFLALFFLFKIYKPDLESDEKLKKYFFLTSFFCWFFYYCGVRFSSENWSAIFFVFGFSIYFLMQKNQWLKFLFIGCCFGFSILFRTQSAALIAGFGLWLLIVKKEKFKFLFAIFISFLLIFGLGILIDRWYYGKWVLTFYNYFYQNIVLNKSTNWGTQSVWFYFEETIVRGIPPISLLIIFVVIAFFYFCPKHPITWCLILFLAIHFYLPHKELRFLFPIIFFLPCMFLSVLQISFLHQKKWFDLLLKACWIVNCIILVIVLFKPLDIHIGAYKFIYSNYPNDKILFAKSNDDNAFFNAGLPVHFFAQTNLQTKNISSFKEIKFDKSKTILFSSQVKLLSSDSTKQFKLVYQTIPEWMYNFNFNHWLERSGVFYLYEMKQ